MKRFCAALICLCLLTAGALADSWTGSVVAGEITQVVNPGDGILASFMLIEGQTVEAGEIVGALRTEKVFAPVSGTVAGLSAGEGDEVDSDVLEISPVSRYTVLCTISNVSTTPETAMIHMGEAVRLRCTADGSHMALGRVVRVDGAEYEVETTAGELYVGETVYVYRGAAYTAAKRIGRGTVTAHTTEQVSAQGVILRMRVAAGDTVEKGQWLFTVASCADPEIAAPAAGVVTSVRASAGAEVRQDEVLVEIAGASVLRITVSADESLRLSPGTRLCYTRADDPHGILRPCTVSRVLLTDGGADVELIPEESLPIGLTVTVTEDGTAGIA